MRHPAVPAFSALVAGALAALWLPHGAGLWTIAASVACWQLALLAYCTSRAILFVAAALGSMALASTAAAQHADAARRHAPIRAMVPVISGPEASRAAITLEGVLLDDVVVGEEGTVLRLSVERVQWDRSQVLLSGGVLLSVAGAPDPVRAREWTRGRRVRAPATLRRPARYLNDGISDGELASMRRGTALTGTIKSASLVEVTGRAPPAGELAGRARWFVRDAVARALGHAPEAGIVTAILIGDRAGLPAEVSARMQRAGTFHVIAISGGNIALFAMLAWGGARVLVRTRRAAALAAIAMVTGYALMVGSGASVGRAAIAALVFLGAAVLDQRTPPLNVLAIVGVLFLLWDPLAIADLGFLLSFAATAGILTAAPRCARRVESWLRDRCSHQWLARAAAAIVLVGVATAAAEAALLPIQAAAFHRVTVAGLALNFIAIPAMAVTQVSGMVLVAATAAGADALVRASAFAAAFGAATLTSSAALVDVVPRLTWRVAAPPGALAASYVSLLVLMTRGGQSVRRALALAAAAAGVAIACSLPRRGPPDGRLHVSMFDVGQAEALLLRTPRGRAILVDAAGPSDRFDIGDRVLVPALLHRTRAVDVLLLTHADLDHVGGAPAVMRDLTPSRVIEGISPALNVERNRIAAAAWRSGATVETMTRGSSWSVDGVWFRVLHPPPPEWERQRVRNDDSVVLEVVFGTVSMLLTGDAGEEVEREVASMLTPVRLRILKAGHHGSRTSTSSAFLEALRPSAAIVSAGRGNFYGHPSAAVLDRLARAHAQVFRTDRDGQIDLVTDGRDVEIRTRTGKRWAIAARQRGLAAASLQK